MPDFKIFLFLVNQESKALVTGFPKNFLVKPGILGKNQVVNQEVPVKLELLDLLFQEICKICCHAKLASVKDGPSGQ